MKPEDWQRLAQEYRELTEDERSHYQALGEAAHRTRKEGLNPFPVNSATASSERRHLMNTAQVKKMEALEIDPIAKAVRDECRLKRDDRKARQKTALEQHSMLQQFHMDHIQQFLHRNRLLQSDTWEWRAFPFSGRTDALHCCLSAKQLAHSTALSNINPTEAASQWEKSHLGISEADFPKMIGDDAGVEIERKKRLTQCWEAGFCCCGSGFGKVWARMWPNLRIDREPQLKKGALEGDLILQWYCPEFTEPIPDDVADLGAYTFSTYIPMMYLRPWRPTFLLVEHQPAESDDRRLAFRADLDEEGHLQCWT